jgi:hypothetical protein
MSSLTRLALFLTLTIVLAPRLSRSQSACVESHTLNATLCYWDVFNHSTVTAPAIVGVTVLPLLHPNRARLFASLNGGPLLPLSAAAAAIAVPPPDAVHSCDSECSGDTVSGGVPCCAMVIDIWFISNESRSNTGCSLYFTVPAQAPPASFHPILKFHGEINSGLQVSAPLISPPPPFPPPVWHSSSPYHSAHATPFAFVCLCSTLVPCSLPSASPLARISSSAFSLRQLLMCDGRASHCLLHLALLSVLKKQ